MKRLANSLKTKRLAQFLCAIAALMTLTACPPDPVDTTGNLVGVVTDARSGALLSGVSVSLSPTGKTYTTGADGKFEFRDIDTQQYTVTASKTNYQTDKKTAFVNVGQTTNVDIQLTPATGALSLSNNSLDFGTETTKLAFEISNTGVAAMKWQLSENAAWLDCNPTSGTVQVGEKASVVVTVDRAGLARGTYAQTIAVTSDGGSGIVNVSMSVQGIAVEFSPEQLDFGSTTSSLPLSLTNTGSGSITYSLTASNEWIKLSKKSGTFSTTESITVTVDRIGLSEGDHSGNLTFSVGDETTNIPVRMNIPSKSKPTVSTITIGNVTYSSVDLKGAIISIGSAKVTKHGFCWSMEEQPTVTDSKCNLGDSDKPKDFTYTATDLLSSSTYYVRAYAENAEGIAYGEQLTFDTKGTPKLADVETGNVTGVTDSQANVTGNLKNLGNVESVTRYGHVWSTKSNPTTDGNKTEFGATEKTGTFNSALTGLLPSTVYHVRAYAVNSMGTSYGEDITFKTLSANDIKLEDYGDDNQWKP